jgi:hypothetical protein
MGFFSSPLSIWQLPNGLTFFWCDLLVTRRSALSCMLSHEFPGLNSETPNTDYFAKQKQKELRLTSRYQIRVFDELVDFCFAKQRNMRKGWALGETFHFFRDLVFRETSETKSFP